eukprot:6194505-Pleurochrysis_carterae.AAC.1
MQVLIFDVGADGVGSASIGAGVDAGVDAGVSVGVGVAPVFAELLLPFSMSIWHGRRGCIQTSAKRKGKLETHSAVWDRMQ